jgi:hypothetical protein
MARVCGSEKGHNDLTPDHALVVILVILFRRELKGEQKCGERSF